MTKLDYDAVNNLPYQNNFSIETGSSLVIVNYKALSNLEVRVFDHSSATNAVTCDLGVVGTNECDIEYKIQAHSVNGTIAT